MRGPLASCAAARHDADMGKTPAAAPPNTLYYGDNLKVLREYVADESVDLVYLDPPFNSNADYNVLFAEKSGEKSAGQIQAFKDTWQWDAEAAANFADAVGSGGRVADAMAAFAKLVPRSDLLAYLSMMAPRLVELRRVLKPTGSLYLHCDPTASHYLKLLLDAVFGPENFRSEISWKRSASHGGAQNFHDVHDTILYVVKSDDYTWTAPRIPHDESYLESHYGSVDPDGHRYQLVSAHGAGPGPARTFGDRLIEPPQGRHWMDQDTIDEWMRKGLVVFTRTGMPRFKRYLTATDGRPIPNVWTDIFPLNSQAQERLGYPTQKPEALLERIIAASSNVGDVVLDPFCGCGTTIAAAQKMDRQWIGIDITHLAVGLIKRRLADMFGGGAEQSYQVVGTPADLASAQALADAEKYQFQFWALDLVGAKPAPADQKKGADKGIDGRLSIIEPGNDVRPVVISVKGGHVTVSQLRDLVGVMDREKAAIGVFICIEEPTAPMRKEAADAGFYPSKQVGGGKHPRVQILTIAELLAGRRIDLPPQSDVRWAKVAPKVKGKGHKQADLF